MRVVVVALLLGACAQKSAPAPAPVASEAPIEVASDAGAGDTEPCPDIADIEQAKNEANRRYDRHDWPCALTLADGVLAAAPDDVRMLRLAASAACLLGEPELARSRWQRLPERDRQQIAQRCARFGVTLP